MPRLRFAAAPSAVVVVGTVRKWDHFMCGVAIVDGTVCVLVAHMTGASWSQFVVTSWQRQGCSSRQLRG